mgnify:CR=1 FL=1
MPGKIQLISRVLGGEIAAYHQSNLEGERVIEFTEIKTRQLLDLVKTVNESVSVNEELSRGLRHVEVIVKEALDSHKCFSVK